MREKNRFNDGWKVCFQEQESPIPTNKGGAYTSAKTERAQWGYAANHYDETHWGNYDQWMDVTLPNDYIITQAPDRNENEAWGYFCYHSACYKKRFFLHQQDRDKRITLYFEGIATTAMIYVNGCLMERSFSAYTPIEVDLTDVANFEEENTICVFVDSTPNEGWWYGGGGIYRDVWLCKTELVSVDLYGVFANPKKVSDTEWDVEIETTIRNDRNWLQSLRVISELLYEGQIVGKTEETVTVPGKEKSRVNKSLRVMNPSLWDIQDPCLYTLSTKIYQEDTEVDETKIRFGFRTAEFHQDLGFLLNGRQVKIKGVCCHEDYGITGRVVPDTVKAFRLKQLKEMGANGYRTAHYPHSDTTMNLLDEMGFLVMCETRWFESTPEGIRQLELMIQNNRNHPSIVLWCTGNEEYFFTNEKGRRIADSMRAAVKRLDPSRPVTNAVDKDADKSPVHAGNDVIGINYNLQAFAKARELFPNKPFLSSENCACATTRGWYFENDASRGYFKSYDVATYAFANTRKSTWELIASHDWISGGYQWAGIEHRGETTWPRLCSQSGALDLFLQKKDAYYQNMSYWTDEPMVHILPHWNHQGREGDTITVWVYTNCDEIELFQDDVSKGKQKIESYGYGVYQLTYQRGTLRVDGFLKNQRVVSQTVETTNPPQRLVLTLETPDITANGRDVAVITCSCVDDQGRFVPDASPTIEFMTNEYGEIIGTGSGVSDHVPVTSPKRIMYAGLCSVAVKVREKAGVLKLYAKADSLEGTVLEIEIKK